MTNQGDMLSPGETLQVECAPGYTLFGETVHCIIQDVYGPDSRLLPDCLKVDEKLRGFGEYYSGSKSTTVTGTTNYNSTVTV